MLASAAMPDRATTTMVSTPAQFRIEFLELLRVDIADLSDTEERLDVIPSISQIAVLCRALDVVLCEVFIHQLADCRVCARMLLQVELP
ncbi:hypothetical protein AOZ06_05335 [Kibdelosporangium phytohabitans]|uniref:Uncharacterized protein n=1 Tax=Kibdelosporangium phytohabitans TaxID=860235 RepID=A0A0N9HX02_9PSEU|nr:hypothetical protein AOZ06_05335 [Kibdelosporangium phytohabitans]